VTFFCACLLFLVSILIVSKGNTNDDVSPKNTEAIQHFRDYAHSVRTLKMSTLSSDIEDNDSLDDRIHYNAVLDFVKKRKKTLYYSVGGEKQSSTEELFVDGMPLVLYYGEEITAIHNGGVQLVMQNISDTRWCDVVSLQFLGYIFFDESENSKVSFWDIVDSMEILKVDEKRLDSGEDIVTIVLSTKKRKIEMSLIPSKQWVPYAIFWEQEPFSPMLPCLLSTKLVYSNHTLISNHWVPMSYAVEMSFSSASITGPDNKELVLPSQMLKWRVDITDIAVNPSLNEKDFSFSIPVPDYTPVIIEDSEKRHIKHVWVNGKIVPWTDEAVLAILRGHKFMPGPDEPRFWLLWIGIILILIGGGRLAYKHFTGKD
jgi:hypothetical protein